MDPLYTLCRQADGVHWSIYRPDGTAIASSDVGFPTREDALRDLGLPLLD